MSAEKPPRTIHDTAVESHSTNERGLERPDHPPATHESTAHETELGEIRKRLSQYERPSGPNSRGSIENAASKKQESRASLERFADSIDFHRDSSVVENWRSEWMQDPRSVALDKILAAADDGESNSREKTFSRIALPATALGATCIAVGLVDALEGGSIFSASGPELASWATLGGVGLIAAGAAVASLVRSVLSLVHIVRRRNRVSSASELRVVKDNS